MAINNFQVREVTLVTHVHPDLDALLGTWLLARYGGFAKFDLAFVPVGRRVENKPNVIHVDTGLTDFDHHNRDDFTCASRLAYDSLFRDKNDPAIEALVNYALKTDWYLLRDDDNSAFSLNSIIEGLNYLHPNDPRRVADHVFEILDGLYLSLSLRIEAEREYARGFEFDSPWGKGFAVESSVPSVREVAYRNGAQLFVFVDPVKGYRGYKARSQAGIDFSELYTLVKTLEPAADWFLHSSHELLLCGSDKAPDRKLSNLTLSDLVNLISAIENKNGVSTKHSALETAG